MKLIWTTERQHINTIQEKLKSSESSGYIKEKKESKVGTKDMKNKNE